MNDGSMRIREMKGRVRAFLRQEDVGAGLQAVADFPARRVVNPLFGLLCDADERVRWHAISAMGIVVAALAEQDMEAARVIMRRLMWSLNDESGGIGWGAPEAMGEIMACHERLGREYAAILISYLNPQGNYLEHIGLQQGLLWGFGRLAHARSHLAAPGAPFLAPFLSSAAPVVRGLAVWAATPLIDAGLKKSILPLRCDPSIITLYFQRCLTQVSIADLAFQAAQRFDGRSDRQ